MGKKRQVSIDQRRILYNNLNLKKKLFHT